MSKDTPTVKNNSINKIIKRGLIVTLVLILFTSLMLFATYPTSSHRTTAAQIEQTSTKSMSEQSSKATEDELIKLYESPENQYTTKLTIATTFAYIVLFIATTGYLYRQIRSQRLAKNPLYTTTNVMVISSIVTTIFSLVLSTVFVGMSAPGVAEFVGVLMANTILTLLMTLLITSFFKNRYDRKHSFEID